MTHGGPCPDTDELQKLANNQLTAAAAFTLQRHLVRCAMCAQMVEALRDASRTLASTPAGGSPFPTTTPTTHLPPPTPEGPEFLAPPQGPDEMGRLGGYRILRLIGTGGMGMVFLAEDLQLQRKVALKVMRPQAGSDDDNRKRFLREARLAASLEHENIVTVYQAGEERGVLFLAMQLLTGQNLEDRFQIEPRLTNVEIVRLARETAEGLLAAHEKGLVHRDIKPSNLWLESRPAREGRPTGFRVKILDFGLARDVGGSDQVTHSGFVVGTAGYIAPEQARGRPPDARSDLFSLGCVLYEASTGACPFQGADAMSRLTALAVERPASPEELNPALPPKLAELILWMLAKEPERRPESARDVIDALEQIFAELGGEPKEPARAAPAKKTPTHAAEPPRPSVRPVPAAAPPETSSSSMTVVIVVVAVVAAVLGFLGFQLLH